MNVPLWRIGTDTPTYTADDPDGMGAKISGGRWNRPGTPVLYTSTVIALACLETLVHLKVGTLPMNRYLVRFDVPSSMWKKAQKLDPNDRAMVGWDAEPAGMVSMEIGQRWLAGKSSALLLVPSAVIPEEINVLINPAHPDAGKISAQKLRKFVYDARLRAVV
ncbi:RES family NAD+ phosphorylase [Dyella silvatica]|uniref:RES family NAD+ phosphorylase n=1 Tax=Dyella silvatica TaxID=2992128 RepID=UPI002259D8A3|nr:RES family NAD+ phosphorylase [Dyella silvatica]